MTYYIETYRPPFPEARTSRVLFNIIRGDIYHRDMLHPTMSSLIKVNNVHNKQEALGVALEYAAGKKVTVERIFGGGNAS